MVGASGAISGLFGGVLRLMQSLGGLRRLWPLIVLWVGASVLLGLVGFPGVAESIAWVAHIGGFAAGLLLFPLFDRRV
jgi:membrane associated rhomboid family serine protease